jgi:hypothetical protein
MNIKMKTEKLDVSTKNLSAIKLVEKKGKSHNDELVLDFRKADNRKR